jgi:cytochrome c oxidase subunit 4
MSHTHDAHAIPPGGIHEVPKIHAAGASDGAGHHGHHIAPAATLLIILGALMFLTLLTVGASMAEAFIATTFDFTIPVWVNVMVAVSIAVVKTALVVLFFMQLKYDNPINGMIFIFTLLTVAFFLGFTMLDLGNRQTIDTFKGAYIQEGGMGLGTDTLTGKPIEGGDVPITVAAAKKAEALHAQEAKDALLNGEHTAEHAASGHEAATHDATAGDSHAAGGHKKVKSKFSNAQQSRPVKGITLEDLSGH